MSTVSRHTPSAAGTGEDWIAATIRKYRKAQRRNDAWVMSMRHSGYLDQWIAEAIRDGRAGDILSDDERFLTVVAELGWTFAKTYAATAPHEYIVKGRTCPPEVYEEMSALVAAYALPEKWHGCTVWY